MKKANKNSISLVAAIMLGAAVLAVQSCSSGSGGSNVGKETNVPPTARPEILNGNGGNTFREGSEVLLSGKASEDKEGPVLAWTWKQVSGPTVELIERNSNSVSFTAPHVAAATKLQFQLGVEDSSLVTSNATIDVNVIPARDSDKFLTLDVRAPRKDTFDTFNVVAGLAAGATTGTTPQPFSLSVRAYLVYPPRSAENADCQKLDPATLATSVPASTPEGCLVQLLQDLTPTPAGAPAGSVGLQGQWPANVTVPGNQTEADIPKQWWNPHFELPIPRLDVADFDQQFVDANQRGQLLDQFNAYKARIVLKFSLVAPSNLQSAATLVLTNAATPNQGITLPAGDPHAFGPTIASVTNAGIGLPTSVAIPVESVLASIPGRESALTSEVYYQTVDPAPGTRKTLNAWLQQAGFLGADGKLLPAALAGTGEFAHAVYLNNYDLGFGRDMHARRDANGNVYSYVVNYQTLEGAIRKTAPIVTVVMEYSPLTTPTDPNKFVKFFTYVDDGTGDARRVSSMNFDGRGERFTPGNCIVCHGGAKPPGIGPAMAGCTDLTSAACYVWPMTNDDSVDITNGNLQSTFLPWDLDSLYFADTDPAIKNAPVPFDGVTLQQQLKQDFGDFSRSAQEAQLKKLNDFARSTYCATQGCPTFAARTLVEYWYQGVDTSGNLKAASYTDAHAPAGWQNNEPGTTNPATAEDLYHNVFARHCRMCHTNAFDDTVRFDTYQKFIASADKIKDTVFARGVMPGARLTDDRFWTHSDGTSPPDRLATELGVQVPVAGPAPHAAIALVEGSTGSVARKDNVRLSGAASSFAHSFLWSTTYGPAPAALAANPALSAYTPTLVGNSTSELSFTPTEPGTYTVNLTINGDENGGAAADPVQLVVPDYLPQPTNLSLLVAEGATKTLSVVDELNKLCAAAGCKEVFGDGPSSVAVDISGWDQAKGTLSVTNATTGTVQLVANKPGPTVANIAYTVTDADLESASAKIQISVQSLSKPVAAADTATVSAQSSLAPVLSSRTVSIPVLANDTGDPAAGALHINQFSQPGHGSVTQNGNNLIYKPNLGFVGTDQFTYKVIDSNTTGGRVSDPGTVTVNVTPTSKFSPDVQTAFTHATCLNAGCHGAPRGAGSAGCPTTTAPDWTQMSQVAQRSVIPPGNVSSSLILTLPTLAACTHSSPTSLNWVLGKADYETVFRWVEEGAQTP